ncbi:MAG: peptidoglycan DD-metalloendopeptidase family protein [Anaerolineales bacterium]
MRRKCVWFLWWVGLLLFILTGPALASNPPPQPESDAVHVVRPGETLFSIAQRYGTTSETLARFNGLADPRQIYVGQHLQLGGAVAVSDTSAWVEHRLRLGESLALLARHAGVDWQTVAVANRLLHPGAPLVGQSLRIPPRSRTGTLVVAHRGGTALSLALRHDHPYWAVAARNSQPLYTGELALLPGSGRATLLPYPIRALELAPQPIIRGQSAVLALETEASIRCEITYLERSESCFQQDPHHYFALVSFSPMLDPAEYDIQMRIWTEDTELALEIPLLVTAGRFGFERINVASRAYLFDPALLQGEAEQVDAIANLHTEQRFWQVPFDYPVHAAVSSYFGSRRSYGGSYNSYHSGVDFRAATGTPIRVPAGGTVILAEPLQVRGNAIIVDHGWGLLTGYWHLSQIDVSPGERVHKGDVIGRVGNTGLSTGAHLHWQIWVDGTPVDPLQWVKPFYPFPDPVSPEISGLQ